MIRFLIALSLATVLTGMQSWADGPSCKLVLSKPIPKVINRFSPTAYPQITFGDGLTIEPLRVRHIFHGDLQAEVIKQGKGPVTVLDGGMHTREAFVDFLSFRPDIARYVRENPTAVEVDKYDVMTFMLPENAFSAKAKRNDRGSQTNGGRGIKKTFFPPKWTNEMILNTIRACASNGRIIADDSRSQTKTITYLGVEVRVFLERARNGWTVSTAYPVGGTAVREQR